MNKRAAVVTLRINKRAAVVTLMINKRAAVVTLRINKRAAVVTLMINKRVAVVTLRLNKRAAIVALISHAQRCHHSRRTGQFPQGKEHHRTHFQSDRSCGKYSQHQQDIYRAFLDCKKAFDGMWHDEMWASMKKYNLG